MYALKLRKRGSQQRSSGVSVETYRSGIDGMADEANTLISQAAELKQRVQQVKQYLEEDIGTLSAEDPANPAISELEGLRDVASNILAYFADF